MHTQFYLPEGVDNKIEKQKQGKSGGEEYQYEIKLVYVGFLYYNTVIFTSCGSNHITAIGSKHVSCFLFRKKNGMFEQFSFPVTDVVLVVREWNFEEAGGKSRETNRKGRELISAMASGTSKI